MMYGAELQACRGTTIELVDCLDARAAYWQAEMEEAFSKVRALLSGDRADRLRAVQELWPAYARVNP
jgi:hypothetical protein